MRSSAAILENDFGNIDPVEQKALDLIRRFNDPDREHALRGVFKDTDGLAEIRAKNNGDQLEIALCESPRGLERPFRNGARRGP